MSRTLVATQPELKEVARAPASVLPPCMASTCTLGTRPRREARQPRCIPERTIRFPARPVVDKAVAALACIPGAWFAYTCYRAGLMNVPRALFFAEMALFVFSMLIRRNPVRISADPLYWLVAFVASYYNFILPTLLRGGALLAPAQVCNSFAVLGLWIAIFARLSLGRNIGLVPAQRQIVTGGAYRYVRHPIYTAHFLCSLGFALSCYSPVNAIAIGLGCGLWVVKTFMEESFLSRDPEYAAYMRKVCWRWFPGLA
ncbi:MAG TPA: isoprenylcysteine carboxylmethyltransferase family protein [Terriglobales bacterium]|nr:isoprenylcysteine carboxylmethyltransferase family protein [Terriglobales bacterium]